MNRKLVETLAEIIQTLTPEEQTLLQEKTLQTSLNQELPFYETATTEEWIREFREWTESHQYDEDTPILSDEAISRESIYSERNF
jgi:hypothetical protein